MEGRGEWETKDAFLGVRVTRKIYAYLEELQLSERFWCP